jgi:hypothetical protein
MENYINELYFNDSTRINHKVNLNIEELEILNEDIVNTINEQQYDVLYCKIKLQKIRKYIIAKLLKIDPSSVYNYLARLLIVLYKEEAFIIKDDNIFQLFSDTIKNLCLFCLKAPNINLNTIYWNIHFLNEPVSKDLIIALLKKGKIIDPIIFLGNINIFDDYMFRITDVNIPEKFDKNICSFIKQRYTLLRSDELKGKVFLLRNNISIKIVVKILIKCLSVSLIKEYLNEKPNFDNDDSGNPYGYMLAKSEEAAFTKYNKEKEKFIKILKSQINDSAYTNTKTYVILNKIISTKADKTFTSYIPKSNNKYEKKIMKLINNENASSS